jgi:hypothetical protein
MVTLQIHNPLFSDEILERRLIGFLTIHNLCIRATWNISVRGSVVFLRGRVNDRRSLARREASCRRVAGVIGVDSSAVVIAPAPWKRASSTAGRRFQGGRNQHVRATVG